VLEWVSVPASLEDLHGKLLQGSNRKNKNFVFLFGYLAWSLWLIINDFIFTNVLVSSPNVSLYRTILFMRKWRVLLREKEQLWTDLVIIKLKHRLSSLRSE
jgi:hypothetical protein